MDRYTFDEVVYIARAIEAAVQDAATVEIECLKCAVGKQEELTLAAMKGMEIAQRRAAKREGN